MIYKRKHVKVIIHYVKMYLYFYFICVMILESLKECVFCQWLQEIQVRMLTNVYCFVSFKALLGIIY